ncbi:MAG: acyltransferase [Acidimicrobiales bacterium]|nr:acyltransferase [Acidimicrobiales bacterium]
MRTGTGETATASGPGHGRVTFPCFEGLRALAAVMVVVHHAAALAGPASTPSALRIPAEVMDSGVAVFFVLSGFLIYRPFAAAHRTGRPLPPTLAFWWRRLLRLVPAYWLALTFFWFLGSFDLGRDWWRYYLFLQIYSRATVLGGLVQAWSLCTEVTFYLMVPVWAWVVGRLVGRLVRHPRQATVVNLVGCALLYAVGFASRAVISDRDPLWRGITFQWLPTNLDLFAVGMVVAVISVEAQRGGRVRELADRLAQPALLWWAAAVALFAWYAWRVGAPAGAQLADPHGAYRGFFWHQRQFTLGLLSLLLLVPAVFGDQDRDPIRRLLRRRPIAWVGAVSYGLYLWHFDWMKRALPRPDNAFGSGGWPGWLTLPTGVGGFVVILAIGLAVGLLFAVASWELVERPLLRFKDLVERTAPGHVPPVPVPPPVDGQVVPDAAPGTGGVPVRPRAPA